MSYTSEELDKMYAELPEDVKDAMSSVDTVQVMKDIKDKYNLHLDKAGDLSAEIAMLMMGAIPPQRFITNLQSSLEVDKATAKEIATIVNDRIFQKILNSLKEIQDMAEKKDISVPQKPEQENIIKEETLEIPKKVVIDPYKEAI